MNPHPLFCPNLTCASRGVQGAGNIRVHDSQRDRWRCTTCHKTFSARQGTPFFGLKTDPAIVAQVVTLLSYGCPLQAIVAAFGYDERTIRDWQDKAGAHCQQVHTALVCQADLDLKQVQADELRVRCQKRLVVWMALALCVPTRLWLGGVVSQSRDKPLARALARLVRTCARLAALLVVTDGWSAYANAFVGAFRDPERTGQRGHPALRVWPDFVLAQTVKARQAGRVIGLRVCHLFGDRKQVAPLLPEGQVLATAYIERFNATLRARLCCLVRRGRALARQPETLTTGMYLVGCLYNFCTPHRSLSPQTPTTPAMAAGLTGYVWSVGELLCFRVAPAPFVPKKRRGRKPKGNEQLVTV